MSPRSPGTHYADTSFSRGGSVTLIRRSSQSTRCTSIGHAARWCVSYGVMAAGGLDLTIAGDPRDVLGHGVGHPAGEDELRRS
jgi:hypothetical protein